MKRKNPDETDYEDLTGHYHDEASIVAAKVMFYQDMIQNLLLLLKKLMKNKTGSKICLRNKEHDENEESVGENIWATHNERDENEDTDNVFIKRDNESDEKETTNWEATQNEKPLEEEGSSTLNEIGDRQSASVWGGV